MEISQYYECNDEFEEFGVEKIMYHPEYQDSFDADNIGLIRLDRKVTYSGKCLLNLKSSGLLITYSIIPF